MEQPIENRTHAWTVARSRSITLTHWTDGTYQDRKNLNWKLNGNWKLSRLRLHQSHSPYARIQGCVRGRGRFHSWEMKWPPRPRLTARLWLNGARSSLRLSNHGVVPVAVLTQPKNCSLTLLVIMIAVNVTGLGIFFSFAGFVMLSVISIPGPRSPGVVLARRYLGLKSRT